MLKCTGEKTKGAVEECRDEAVEREEEQKKRSTTEQKSSQ